MLQCGHTSSGMTGETVLDSDKAAEGEAMKSNPDLFAKNRKVPPTIAAPAKPVETISPLEAQKESRYSRRNLLFRYSR